MAVTAKKGQTSILDTLKNKKKKVKGDKYWMIPVITIGVAILIFVSFFAKAKFDDYFDQIEEPWTMSNEDAIVKAMENDESFMIFVYAEWCPYCKQVMFGSQDSRRGTGSLKTWRNSRGSSVNFKAFWEQEKNDENRVADWYKNVETKLNESKVEGVSADSFDWRNNVWKYDAEKDVAERDLTFDKTSTRPGVPSFLYVHKGELKAVYSGADLTNIGYDYLYRTFVDPNFVKP